MPEPRCGWDALVDKLLQVRSLPGSQSGRAQAARWALAKWAWAAPFLDPSQAARRRLPERLMQAVVRARCSWWCRRRWYVDNLSLHPLGVAVQSLKMARGLPWSALLEKALRLHTKALGLEPASVTGPAPIGVWVQAGPNLDARARAALAACSPDGIVDASSPTGQHACRVVARSLLLQERSSDPRNDEEGMGRIDIDASSQCVWAEWRRRLCSEDASLLAVFRGGASWTPTRRFARPSQETEQHAKCPWCAHSRASMKHFVTECPHFLGARQALEAEGVPLGWWTAQPRVTTKSGWVCDCAGGSAEERARRQISVCKLGIQVLRALSGVKAAIMREAGFDDGDDDSRPRAPGALAAPAPVGSAAWPHSGAPAVGLGTRKRAASRDPESQSESGPGGAHGFLRQRRQRLSPSLSFPGA